MEKLILFKAEQHLNNIILIVNGTKCQFRDTEGYSCEFDSSYIPSLISTKYYIPTKTKEVK